VIVLSKSDLQEFKDMPQVDKTKIEDLAKAANAYII